MTLLNYSHVYTELSVQKHVTYNLSTTICSQALNLVFSFAVLFNVSALRWKESTEESKESKVSKESTEESKE